MLKKQNRHLNRLILFCVCAFLSSLSIVLGKYLAINLGETIRISFENLPIIFAGIFFGPIAGGIVGVVSDLTGCILVGYTINPIITLGAFSIGVLSGIFGKGFSGGHIFSIPVSVIASHLMGSVFIKTVGLYVYFSMPFLPTLFWRFLTYIFISFAESAILILLSKSQALIKEIKRIRGDLL